MKEIYILSANSWRREIRNLKHLGSFKVPGRIIKFSNVADGQKRKIIISPSNADAFELLSTITSGCELLIPKNWQSRLVGSDSVEFEIIDWESKLVESHDKNLPDIDEDFYEGVSTIRTHLLRERNRRLVYLAKQKRIVEKGVLECDVCGFSFKQKYGELGKGFIEVHHLNLLSKRNIGLKTNINDLALLCSNCHRMIHRGEPILTIKELKSLINK